MFHFVTITLHRDDFRVKLIDFGLAKELDANNRVRTGFAGTVGRTSFSRKSKVFENFGLSSKKGNRESYFNFQTNKSTLSGWLHGT